MAEIFHLENDKIDKKKWDKCIENSFQCQIYALSWYLDIISPSWQALVIENDSGYVTVIPLPVSRKYGINYIKQPYDCMQLGIFSTCKNIDSITIESLCKRIQSRFPYILSYHFNIGNSNLPLIRDLNGFNTHVLDLSFDYQILSTNYTKYRKRRVNKSYRSGLKIVEKEDHKPLIRMVREFLVKKNHFNIPEEAFTQMDKLIQVLKKKVVVKCYYTIDENGEFQNGALFVQWKNKINYFYSASSELGRKKNGMSLILDTIIRNHSNQPIILDFESPISNCLGVYSFYESFGAKPVAIKVWEYDHLPKLIKWLRSQRRKLTLKISQSVSKS